MGTLIEQGRESGEGGESGAWLAADASQAWTTSENRETRCATARAGVGRFDNFRILVAPGLHDSGEEHWQTRWQRRYPAFERIEQHDWSAPDLATWSAEIGHTLRRSAKPAVIVAHSFGCLATVHQAMRARGGPSRLAGALLVAPADPEKFGVAQALRGGPLAIPTVVIGSTNDPWMRADRARAWAAQWGSEFINAGALGHINAESGLGDWLSGLFCLHRLLQRLPASPSCRCQAGRH